MRFRYNNNVLQRYVTRSAQTTVLHIFMANSRFVNAFTKMSWNNLIPIFLHFTVEYSIQSFKILFLWECLWDWILNKMSPNSLGQARRVRTLNSEDCRQIATCLSPSSVLDSSQVTEPRGAAVAVVRGLEGSSQHKQQGVTRQLEQIAVRAYVS